MSGKCSWIHIDSNQCGLPTSYKVKEDEEGFKHRVYNNLCLKHAKIRLEQIETQLFHISLGLEHHDPYDDKESLEQEILELKETYNV